MWIGPIPEDYCGFLKGAVKSFMVLMRQQENDEFEARLAIERMVRTANPNAKAFWARGWWWINVVSGCVYHPLVLEYYWQTVTEYRTCDGQASD